MPPQVDNCLPVLIPIKGEHSSTVVTSRLFTYLLAPPLYGGSIKRGAC
ncbi:protein of unknown function [Thauera humireducens]|nr:protein of unknown function [Thauera humireducens]